MVAAEAKSYGRGGVQTLARITGMCRQTIYRGLKDLQEGHTSERVRKPGGGRKKLSEQNPGLLQALEELIAPTTRGDPESPLKWTCKSVRNLENALKESGHAISYRTVANILHQLEYSLQSNRKTSEGKENHPDRDEQFQYINEQAKGVSEARGSSDFCGHQEEGTMPIGFIAKGSHGHAVRLGSFC